jgi:hypothetical protein
MKRSSHLLILVPLALVGCAEEPTQPRFGWEATGYVVLAVGSGFQATGSKSKLINN